MRRSGGHHIWGKSRREGEEKGDRKGRGQGIMGGGHSLVGRTGRQWSAWIKARENRREEDRWDTRRGWR